MTRRPICTCAAYPWPHNLGRGKCDASRADTEPTGYCGDCNLACKVRRSDYGYWYSLCCHAKVFADARQTTTYDGD